MRVLHAYKIYSPDSFGGILNVIGMLALLPQQLFQTFVLAARVFGFGRSFVVDGVAVQAVGSFGTLLSMPIAPTYPFVLAWRARRVDLVAYHSPFPLADLGLMLGLPRRTALVVHWHAEIVGRPLLRRILAPLARRTLARADRIVVSDPAMLANSEQLAPFATKCTVIPYGCDTGYWRYLDERQQASVNEIRQRWPRLVVAVGRLVSYKGYECLIQALRDVDAHMVIIGEGRLRSELESLAERLGVTERVSFAEGLPRDRVKEYVHAATVFAFPSINEAEAFGIAQLEAMSAGRPVVNTSLPTAVPGIARDRLEGLTVLPNDPQALATALTCVLDDPALALRLGSAGQARASTDYDQSVFLHRMQALYREAAETRTSAR